MFCLLFRLKAMIIVFFKDDIKMIATIELEKYIVGTCILGIVVYKLGYWLEPSLIILFKVDKSFKIGFYSIVLLFYFAVGLRYKINKEPFFGDKKLTK